MRRALLVVVVAVAIMAPVGAAPTTKPPRTHHTEDAPGPLGFDAPPWLGWTLAAGAAGGLVLVGYATRAWWRPPLADLWRFLGGAGLFARLTRRDVADHPLRARIRALVESEPGLPFADAAARLGANAGTLEYHVDILERAGYVRTMKAGRNRLLFPPGGPIDAQAFAALATEGRPQVARLVAEGPGIHAAAIARRLGLARATVHHHLDRLEHVGLVRIERGLRARCYPTDRLLALYVARSAFDQDKTNA
jgi:DNA-binding MarR family transcriptional regulator